MVISNGDGGVVDLLLFPLMFAMLLVYGGGAIFVGRVIYLLCHALIRRFH